MPTEEDDRKRRLEEDPDDWTKEDILEDIRIGMQQALAGEGRPAREVLEELRRELDDDEDKPMAEWVDITITGRDKMQSETVSYEDSELSKQVFTLSDMPPARWLEICNAALLAEPGRLGRQAEVSRRRLAVWGGPNVFDERDANHLKKLLALVNDLYREALDPPDFGGQDAFGLDGM